MSVLTLTHSGWPFTLRRVTSRIWPSDGSAYSNVLFAPLRISAYSLVPPRSCPSANPSPLPPLERTTPSLPMSEIDTEEPKSMRS